MRIKRIFLNPYRPNGSSPYTDTNTEVTEQAVDLLLVQCYIGEEACSVEDGNDVKK